MFDRPVEEAAKFGSTAEAAGVLVEVVEQANGPLPFDEGDFDLALVDAVSAPVAEVLPELKRVLRPGGRVVLVVRQKAPGAPTSAEVQALTAGHLKGARVLFERDGYGIVDYKLEKDAAKGRWTQIGSTDLSFEILKRQPARP